MKPKKIWTPNEREMMFRKNYGKMGRKQYLQKLSAFFATPVKIENLLDLEQTDAVMRKERAVLQQQQWISMNSADINALYPISTNRAKVLALYPVRDYKDTSQILEFMQSLLDKQSCYIYWYNDSYNCGIYQTNRGAQINIDYAFVKHKPDDIWLYATDDRFGFHLEYMHDEVLYDDSIECCICVRLLECTYTIYMP